MVQSEESANANQEELLDSPLIKAIIPINKDTSQVSFSQMSQNNKLKK